MFSMDRRRPARSRQRRWSRAGFPAPAAELQARHSLDELEIEGQLLALADPWALS